MFRTEVVEKMKTFVFNDLFLENCACYEIMWINILEPDRPQITIGCMRMACWIHKAAHTTHTHTHTHSQYVILITLRASVLRYTYIVCLVWLVISVFCWEIWNCAIIFRINERVCGFWCFFDRAGPLSTGVVYSRLEERGYQMLCLCSCSSWGWACQGPKHVEDSNVTYMFILKCALKLVEEIILCMWMFSVVGRGSPCEQHRVLTQPLTVIMAMTLIR